MNQLTTLIERRQRSREVQLDDVDLAILRTLAEDGRMPNKDLAQRAHIAPSTCLNRVRALRSSGVIRGFHADIDPRALGLDVSALIAVRITTGARTRLMELARRVRELPEVLGVFVVGGDHDLLVNVVCASTDELRDFVAEHLADERTFAQTQTRIVFDQL